MQKYDHQVIAVAVNSAPMTLKMYTDRVMVLRRKLLKKEDHMYEMQAVHIHNNEAKKLAGCLGQEFAGKYVQKHMDVPVYTRDEIEKSMQQYYQKQGEAMPAGCLRFLEGLPYGSGSGPVAGSSSTPVRKQSHQPAKLDGFGLNVSSFLASPTAPRRRLYHDRHRDDQEPRHHLWNRF